MLSWSSMVCDAWFRAWEVFAHRELIQIDAPQSFLCSKSSHLFSPLRKSQSTSTKCAILEMQNENSISLIRQQFNASLVKGNRKHSRSPHHKLPLGVLQIFRKASARSHSLFQCQVSAVLHLVKEEYLTIHSLAGLVATGAMLPWEYPLLDAPFGATRTFHARHLGWLLLAKKRERR